MVIPSLIFWRTANISVHEDGEQYSLLDNRGKAHGTLFPVSKKKSRRMQLVFALLLSWCITGVLFSISYGVPSLPGYDYTVEQVFPVRQLLITGWEKATLQANWNEEARHIRKLATEIEKAELDDHQIDYHTIVDPHSAQTENEVIVQTEISRKISTVSDHELSKTDHDQPSDHIKKDRLISHDVGANHQQRSSASVQVQSGKNGDENNSSRKSGDMIASSFAQINNANTEVSKSSKSTGTDVEKPRNDDVTRDYEREPRRKDEENVHELLGKRTEKISDDQIFMASGEGSLKPSSEIIQVLPEINCDRSHWRTDVCVVKGDVRVKTKLVQLQTSEGNEKNLATERIKPYTRKWEMPLMGNIDEVTIEAVNASSLAATNQTVIACNLKHSVPAIIFSTGGYTGNVYHDFSDGLIPIYITSRHLHGEVVFLVLDFHEWWLNRYGGIINQLSNYPVIDLRNDQTVHCFPEVTVGLRIHDELTVNADQMPAREGSIKDFHLIIQNAFTNRLPTTTANGSSSEQVFAAQTKPKLVLIARRGSRSISNQAAVVDLIKRLGFEVDVLEPHGGTRLEDIFNLLNSCDIMMGVHGAAMTHLLFMRPGATFIQIIPLGTDGPSMSFYGQPAMKLGLHYMEYKVKPKESSLSRKYKKSSEILTNPEAVTSRGWLELKKYYLDGQSVNLNLRRLKLVLQKALKRIKKRRSRSN